MNNEEARAAFAAQSPVMHKRQHEKDGDIYSFISAIKYERSRSGEVKMYVELNEKQREGSCGAHSVLQTIPKLIELVDEEGLEFKTKPTKREIIHHKYGKYNNVLLTDEEYQKIHEEFPRKTRYQEAWDYWVEALSNYKKATGKHYANDLAAIRNWARKHEKEMREKEERREGLPVERRKNNKFNNYEDTNKPDYSDFANEILKNMLEEENDK